MCSGDEVPWLAQLGIHGTLVSTGVGTVLDTGVCSRTWIPVTLVTDLNYFPISQVWTLAHTVICWHLWFEQWMTFCLCLCSCKRIQSQSVLEKVSNTFNSPALFFSQFLKFWSWFYCKCCPSLYLFLWKSWPDTNITFYDTLNLFSFINGCILLLMSFLEEN